MCVCEGWTVGAAVVSGRAERRRLQCPSDREGWFIAKEKKGNRAGLGCGVGQSWEDLLMYWEQLGAREAEGGRMTPRFLPEKRHGRRRHLL